MLFYVLIVCTVTLPPGVNPIAVDKYINKEKLPEKWKESIVVPIYEKGDKTDFSNYRGMLLLQILTKFYPISCCQG